MTIKSFAQVSRRVLMDGVYQKLLFWGFDEHGAVVSEPDKIQGGFVLRGEAYDDPTAPVLWQALKKAIATKGLEVVVEEAAYTGSTGSWRLRFCQRTALKKVCWIQ